MRHPSVQVAIIGAGPYGLSLAAHLRALNVEFRIFGSPMSTWRTQMPAGMFLKSEGFASTLSDPQRQYTMPHYCAKQGLNSRAPISLTTFVRYGLWFQQALVPEVEDTEVVALRRADDGFTLELATGEKGRARRVVIASGIGYFAHVPPMLAALPQRLVSHSSQHNDLSAFSGRDITIIGGGQSALETAALLQEHGAYPRVLVRKPALVWNRVPDPHRPLRQRLRYPAAGLGDGWPSWFYERVPMGAHYFPQDMRVQIVRESYGPAGAWWLKDRVVNRVQIMLGCSFLNATADGDGVRLRFSQHDQSDREIHTEHVIAATGFRVDIGRLPFLDCGMRAEVHRIEGAPALSRHFESSVKGLYFIGVAAANSFGPLLRFVHGTGFAAPRLAKYLARDVGR